MNNPVLIKKNFYRIKRSINTGYIMTLTTKVSQFEGRNGAVKNQFILTTSEGEFFQSYDSVIAFKPTNEGKIKLDAKYWDYSTTTGKYRNQFLGEDKKATEKKIAAGEYELTNLN